MSLDRAYRHIIRQLTPHTVRSYAASLGWMPVPGHNGDISVYHRPDSQLHQMIIPEDLSLVDYEEAMAEALQKLADFQHRPLSEVLTRLMSPSADILQFSEIGVARSLGQPAFDDVVRVLNCSRQMLLSAAHFVLSPQPVHVRLSQNEALEWLADCRMGEIESLGLSWSVICPHQASGESEIVTRRILRYVINSLNLIADAGVAGRTQSSSENWKSSLNANFCEWLAQLRPRDKSAVLRVEGLWNRTVGPSSLALPQSVELTQQSFDMAAELAHRLREGQQPKSAEFFGFVTALKGASLDGESRPSGEVEFLLMDREEGESCACGWLNADDYTEAATAHLTSRLVSFRGLVRRGSRMRVVEEISDFALAQTGRRTKSELQISEVN